MHQPHTLHNEYSHCGAADTRVTVTTKGAILTTNLYIASHEMYYLYIHHVYNEGVHRVTTKVCVNDAQTLTRVAT